MLVKLVRHLKNNLFICLFFATSCISGQKDNSYTKQFFKDSIYCVAIVGNTINQDKYLHVIKNGKSHIKKFKLDHLPIEIMDIKNDTIFFNRYIFGKAGETLSLNDSIRTTVNKDVILSFHERRYSLSAIKKELTPKRFQLEREKIIFSNTESQDTFLLNKMIFDGDRLFFNEFRNDAKYNIVVDIKFIKDIVNNYNEHRWCPLN